MAIPLSRRQIQNLEQQSTLLEPCQLAYTRNLKNWSSILFSSETLISGLILTNGSVLWRGEGAGYIGQSINPEPSDQTDLNKQRRCNLGDGGEPTQQWEADRWALGASQPTGGAGHLASLALRFSVVSSRVFQNPLGVFLLWISMIESSIQVHLDGFQDKPCRK